MPRTYSTKKADLATWPSDAAHPAPPAARYAELLRVAVLKVHARVLIETVIVSPDKPLAGSGGPPAHFTCYARVTVDGVPLKAGIRAFGSTAQAAKDAAELRALRAAAGVGDVPMLGRLLSRQDLTVDLRWRPCSTPSGRFELDITLYSSGSGRQGGAAGPTVYSFPVQVTKFDKAHGTSYLRAKDVPAPVSQLLAPFLGVVERPYVHRIVLALDQRPLSGLGAWSAARTALGLRPHQGSIRHGHHLDGDGLNSGIWNLAPLGIKAHHDVHHGDRDLNPDLFTMKGTGGVWPIIIPAPTLITRHGVLGQPVPDSVWGVVAPLSGAEADTSPFGTSAAMASHITEAEILRSGVRSDFAETLMDILDALREQHGQGAAEIVKNATCAHALSETTVRRALKKLVELGFIREVRLTGKIADERPRSGEVAHFRLARPLGW